jgi:hypothetical protein
MEGARKSMKISKNSEIFGRKFTYFFVPIVPTTNGQLYFSVLSNQNTCIFPSYEEKIISCSPSPSWSCQKVGGRGSWWAGRRERDEEETTGRK